MRKIYYVSKQGSDQNIGTKQNPFATIQKAAEIAVAGDKVIVHKGEYREWVRPNQKFKNMEIGISSMTFLF